MLLRIFSITLLLFCLCACSKSPQEKFADHMSKGTTYMEEGRFKEAVLEYQNALQMWKR